MKHPALAIVIVVAALAGASATSLPIPQTHIIHLNGRAFTLPIGFTIERVAGPPLVNRPITADFDEGGHLYVSDSSGSNEPVAVQLEKKPHRIVRLTDTKGDGHYDRAVVFADKMMFPAGTMWLNGSLYVAAPPSIWKLTDADGDGVAETREEWFQGHTLTGCANDLHGPYRGPDGWIYWCKGAFAKQSYESLPTRSGSTQAAHIFRARPDGTGIEAVMTGGMDNPVDVVFTPGGERIFSTTFLQHPAAGRRDGLIHAIYGGVYGKDHEPIYEHPWTSPQLMPVMTHLGPAAPSGLHRYDSDAFGREYRDNLFCAQFNMRKISRHVLIPEGSTFRTQDEDFLVSDNFDFHPTDVIEDADGSLLVIDTGGWYKLCCPTAQLAKPDVHGAIYRIRKVGMPKLPDPRGTTIDWKQINADHLAKLLDDPRPVVRRRAIEELRSRNDRATANALLPIIRSRNKSAIARRNAVWAASASSILCDALRDSDELVRQAALHAICLTRDKSCVKSVADLLQNPSMHNRRAAAEALGRIGDASAVQDLFKALAENNDRILDHSLTYALIEIGNRDLLHKGLSDSSPRVRRAALTALDQMKGGNLEAKSVVAELQASEKALRGTAAWIAGRHPEWIGEMAEFYRQQLAADLAEAEREDLTYQLARFASQKVVQDLLANALRSPQPARARIALHAMARAGLNKTPDHWVIELTAAFLRDDIVADAMATARAVNPGSKVVAPFVAALKQVGSNEQLPESLRLSALAAVPAGKLELDDHRFAWLITRLHVDQPPVTRNAAADVLARAKLNNEQLQRLAANLKHGGPMEVTKLLPAFANSNDETTGLALIAALNDQLVRPALHADAVKQTIAKYGPKVAKAAEPLFAALLAGQAEQLARLDRLQKTLKDGDIRRGQAVFNSSRAACATCHTIGYVGGKIGPDLTRIGKIRTQRDLLESIVVPSASFVRGYEPVQVVTASGKQYNGLVKKDSAEEIVLTLNATDEVRISRNDIESMAPSRVSIMPNGLDQQLTPAELADLVAFLKGCQ